MKGFFFMDIQVYQVRLKLYFLCDLPVDKVQKMVTFFIDKSFLLNNKFMHLHEQNNFKNYCYDLPYPAPRDKVYRKDMVYTLTIRTIDQEMAEHFVGVCADFHTRELKGLTATKRILPKDKIIEFLFTLTPVILKDDTGYWQNSLLKSDFAQRLEVNMLKKYRQFTGEDLADDFNWFSTIEFLNRTPVPMYFKNVKLLGDKVRLCINDNPSAQSLAYLALGTGIGEMNSRGAGFVNFRWL